MGQAFAVVQKFLGVILNKTVYTDNLKNTAYIQLWCFHETNLFSQCGTCTFVTHYDRFLFIIAELLEPSVKIILKIRNNY